MDIMESNSSIYVQAKIEYTKQLINVLQSHMYDGIKSIYDDSKELYKQTLRFLRWQSLSIRKGA